MERFKRELRSGHNSRSRLLQTVLYVEVKEQTYQRMRDNRRISIVGNASELRTRDGNNRYNNDLCPNKSCFIVMGTGNL